MISEVLGRGMTAESAGTLGHRRNGTVLFQDTLIVEEGDRLGRLGKLCELTLTCTVWGSCRAGLMKWLREHALTCCKVCGKTISSRNASGIHPSCWPQTRRGADEFGQNRSFLLIYHRFKKFSPLPFSLRIIWPPSFGPLCALSI